MIAMILAGVAFVWFVGFINGYYKWRGIKEMTVDTAILGFILLLTAMTIIIQTYKEKDEDQNETTQE